MRWNLLKTYDKIYTIDLHGNSKKKEVSPDGSIDQNIFDIMQGVSINLFVKTGEKKNNELGKIFHYDLYGQRENKYQYLWNNSISSVPYVELPNIKPNYFFVQKDFTIQKQYDKGFSVSDLFVINSAGIVTARDKFTIKDTKEEVINTINNFVKLEVEDARIKYSLGKDVRDWKVNLAQADLEQSNLSADNICKVSYRIFDERWTYYTGKSKGFHCMPRGEVMQHFIEGENIGLVYNREQKQGDLLSIFIVNKLIDAHLVDNISYIAPLYLYPTKTQKIDINGEIFVTGEQERKPNLNQEIVNKIAKKLSLPFVTKKTSTPPKVETNSPPLEGCPERFRDGVAEDVAPPTTISTINNRQIKRNFVKNLPYNPKLKKLAREKRQEGILSEVLFWQQVHKGKFHKIDFDRQRIIGNYIVDFYVKALGLVVEIDGSSHDDKVEYDAERQRYLEDLGLVVYRIADIDVKRNLDRVMGELERFVVEKFGVVASTENPTPSRKTSGHPSKGGEFQEQGFAPIDILDYIYAVLHSPTYREKYKEFLKIDFPRVPYPKDKNTFWQLVKLGGEIRQIHLLESPKVEDYITTYPKDGSNTITTKVAKKDWELFDEEKELGRIWINEEQYFDNIPLIAWKFYIGGYQPAQKWLKDRKGRTLSFEDILHYQKIIVALFETDRLMREIDKIEIE